MRLYVSAFLSKGMKILIVKLSSIGDVVHTLPVLAAIRPLLAGAEISWAVEKSAAEILRGNLIVKNLIEIDTRSLRGGKIIEKLCPMPTAVRKSARSAFDIALDFQGLLKSADDRQTRQSEKALRFFKQNLREPASRFLLTETVRSNRKFTSSAKIWLAEKALNIEMPNRKF